MCTISCETGFPSAHLKQESDKLYSNISPSPDGLMKLSTKNGQQICAQQHNSNLVLFVFFKTIQQAYFKDQREGGKLLKNT